MQQYIDLAHMPDEPFRAYDIRGDTKILTKHVVFAIAKAIALELVKIKQDTIIVGRDGRLSSPSLMQALQDGLTSMGINIVDLGVVSSPMVYFATCNLECNSGISLTASHNPKNHNGLKIILNGKSLTADNLQDLKIAASQKIQPSSYKGWVKQHDISEQYISTICQQIQLKKKLKVVVDCGNGAGSEIAPRVFAALGCEVIPLFCKIDGNFPNHHPDPGCPENLVDIKKAVVQYKADVGLAFDGDADRLGVVTGQGEVVWPDKQMILFAKDLLHKKPGAQIIFDVKCSDILYKAIKDMGGDPIMWKTGHSLIKSKMREINASLAGEMSGHIFFGSPWFGFDDGIFAGAKMLEYIDKSNVCLTTIINQLPITYSTHELKVPVLENEKDSSMQALAQNIPKDCIINDLDGLRLSFPTGWLLVRPSNTTPYLTIRFEASNKQDFEKIRATLLAWLRDTCPKLDLAALY